MAESEIVREVETLIQEGMAAARAGDMYEARKRFRRVTELAPDNVEAWLGMATAVRPFREKQEYLQRVLALDPSHEEARVTLTYVEQKLSAGELLAPRDSTGASDGMESTSTQPAAQPATANHTTPPPTRPASEADVMYCYRHPDRETVLTCTQCGNPICHECIRPAFVGQLCPDCARERRPPNYQVTSSQLAIAASFAFVCTLLVSFLVVIALGGIFFGFILALIFGPMYAEFLIRVLDRIIRAKRGRQMQLAVGLGMALGALVPFVLYMSLFLHLLIFAVVAISTAVARLR